MQKQLKPEWSQKLGKYYKHVYKCLNPTCRLVYGSDFKGENGYCPVCDQRGRNLSIKATSRFLRDIRVGR